MNRKSLGKGLSSLIPDETLDSIQQAYIPDLPITKIIPNQYQPRVELDPDKLIDLADSIREHGVIEPLIVTKSSQTEFELIAGERRWRAAKLAGLKTLPVVVKEASPRQMLELAIVENIQREDLNPLEEAMAFDQLAKKFDLTHGEIADKVGYSRPAVANKIRLLQLPDDLKKGLISGELSEGHARALLGIKEEQTMQVAYRIVIRDSLSVRATERLVQRLNQKKIKPPEKKIFEKSEFVKKIEQDIKGVLRLKVQILPQNKGGKLTIVYDSQKDLENIRNLLSGKI
jgi:ParB family transcriptional regulator, chromosome partitioning protein